MENFASKKKQNKHPFQIPMKHLKHWWYIRPQKEFSKDFFNSGKHASHILQLWCNKTKTLTIKNGQIKMYPLEI